MNKSCCVLLLFFFFLTRTVVAFDYQLKAEEIAKDTYVFLGLKEDFSIENGGNIVNTGFIVTDKGVLVIDAGPSLQYGQQMRKAIEEITTKPIIMLFITHEHPDHFFGIQAFEDIPTYATQATIDGLHNEAEFFLDNMYRMAGDGMSGTEVRTAHIQSIDQLSNLQLDHQLKFLQYKGHTASDLLIFDETTGVLFSGDFVFNDRALTTPHAHPQAWLSALDEIMKIDYRLIVPGHGEVSSSLAPVEQTKDYLAWLEKTIKEGVNEGLDMNELLSSSIPERFSSISLVNKEFARSVSHRYPIHESKLFEQEEN